MVAFLADEYHVLGLTDPVEALARLEGGEMFDVILCDLVMPRMNGMEVVHRLRASRPDAASRIVFLTGGALLPALRAFLVSVPNLVIEKPFTMEEVRLMIATRMAHASSRAG